MLLQGGDRYQIPLPAQARVAPATHCERMLRCEPVRQRALRCESRSKCDQIPVVDRMSSQRKDLLNSFIYAGFRPAFGGYYPNILLNFSRQRARVGPMLACGIFMILAT